MDHTFSQVLISYQRMRYLLTPYSGTFLATTVISALVTILVWQRRASLSGKVFALMMLSATGLVLVNTLEAAAVEQATKIVWSKWEYVGTQSILVLLLLFALLYNGQEQWLTRHRVILLCLIPAFNVTMVATNEWHQLVWTGFTPSQSATNLLIYHHGPYFWFIVAFSYTYFLVATGLLIKMALHSPHRRQAVAVLIASAIPWIGNALYVFELSPLPGLNLMPAGFVLTGLILWLAIVRFQLLDLIPVARDRLIEVMGDGVLVLDEQGRIVDINPAAHALLAEPSVRVGQDVKQALARWPELLRLCRDEESPHGEVQLGREILQYVDPKVFPLRDRRGRFTGKLITLRDVTARHRAEAQLREANEALQARLEEIETLHDRLREEAIRDAPTGLFNRRYLQETLPRELSRAAREGLPVVLAMMDIDHFKGLNDTFGHKAGDLVLHALGELLRGQTRREDIVCRYGGDELVLVFTGLPAEHAHRRIDGLRLSIQALHVEHEGRRLSTTVSVGVVTFPTHGETSEDLLQAADRALYMAKASGGNCVKCLPVSPEAHTGSTKMSSPTIPG